MDYGNKSMVMGIQKWVPGTGDVQRCFNFCCPLGSLSKKSHSQRTRNDLGHSWDFSAWVLCAETRNSKQKSLESCSCCGSVRRWLCLGPQLSVTVPAEVPGDKGPLWVSPGRSCCGSSRAEPPPGSRAPAPHP